MLEGGDLDQAEELFFQMIWVRTEDHVENWVKSLRCLIIRVDGTLPIEINVSFIVREIMRYQEGRCLTE